MGGIVDFIFGYDEPEPANITVEVPGKTPAELELIDLQRQILEKVSAGPTAEEQQLYNKQKEYIDQLIADMTLSPEEEAEFEKEYGLKLEALREQFGEETEKYGSKQLASLVSRGMLETSTGEQEIAETQQRFAEILSGSEAEMTEAKELAKSDLDAAKRSLSQQGYQLTTGMQQSQIQTALQAAMGLESYYMNRGGMQASAALQNALTQQAINKSKYQQRMDTWSALTGLGGSIMKAGFM